MAREAFYRRIEQAFTFFESQVAAGRIRYYGVSSNTVTADPSDAEATSLSRMCDAARVAAASQGIEPTPLRGAAMPHESL